MTSTSSQSGTLWLSLALAILAFLPSLRGEFVYDDQPQILDNHLIQDPSLLPKALSSDVWAFRGEREKSWSHYWRPIFVAWLAAEYAVFGVESTLPWHLANLTLHLLVLGLAHRWMLQLGLSPSARGLTLVLFAVHPVHVESVVWISGSPDLLMAVFTLGCLILASPQSDHFGQPVATLGSALLFALALLTKEAAITVPALVAFQIGLGSTLAFRRRMVYLAQYLVPMILVVFVYLPTRIRVLGHFQIETPWKLPFWDLVANVPQLLTFYLRQSLAPWVLSPSYPIRAISLSDLGLANFWLPLLIGVALGGWLIVAFFYRKNVALGWLLFGLLLAPAFNISAFIPEQIIHDRYLYLPLLGLLLAVTLSIEWLFGTRFGPWSPKAVFGFSLFLAAPLMMLTIGYSKAWTSEINLWRLGVEVDPSSAFNRAQLGHVLLTSGDLEAALLELNRALEITPVTAALVDRSEIYVQQGLFREAESDLRRVVADQSNHVTAVVRLANALQQQRRIPEAISVLETGRREATHHPCTLTSNLAVLLVISGEREAARRELESVLNHVGREQEASCTLVPFHLGTLARESGNFDQAADYYERFLHVSQGESHDMVVSRRRATLSWLERYRSQG